MSDFRYTFTKNQLEVFREICLGRKTVNEIAAASGRSSKTVYRITEALTNAGMISKSGCRGVQFLPGMDLRSTALKRYILSNDHPIDAIVGSKLLLMLSISHVSKSMERIAMETRLKRDTVRVLAWSLKNYGIINQEGSNIRISPTDFFMTQFLQDFSKGVNLNIMEDKTPVGIMLWSGGLECVFSTPSLEDSSGIRKTGISAMANYGIRFVSETEYYHYSNWNSELKPEDIVIHNLLSNPFSSRVVSYSILLLKKTGFDKAYLLEESRYAGIGHPVREMIAIMSGKATKNRFMPSMADLEDLCSQYGVI